VQVRPAGPLEPGALFGYLDRAMDLPPLTVRCGNCGADVPVESLADFTACGHCQTALYIGLIEGIVHLTARAAIAPGAVPGLLAGRLADLEISGKPAEIEAELVHVPFWRVPGPGGVPRLVAAASPGASGLDGIMVSGGGELMPFDPVFAERGPVLEPEVALEDVLAGGDGADADFRPALVHVPIHRLTYNLGGREWRAAVEAISGRVEADEWPPSSHRRKNRLLGAIAVGAFFAFMAEVALLPEWWMVLLAYAATAAATHAVSLRAMARLET